MAIRTNSKFLSCLLKSGEEKDLDDLNRPEIEM